MKTPNTTGCQNPPRGMKKLAMLALLGALSLTQSLLAQPALPVYEPFNYPISERIGTTGSSGTNWSSALNSTGTGSAMMTNSALLSYPGLPADTSMCLWFTPVQATSGRNRGLPFQPEFLTNSNPTLYYSFLLNVVSNPAAGLKQVLALSSTTNSLSTAMTVFLTADGKLALGKNSSTAATVTNGTALSAGTHLIVVRYKFNTGSANDEFALWQDPGSLGAAEGSVPAVSASTTSGSDATGSTLGSVCVVIVANVPATPSGSFYIDELRIAKTWAAVTPSSCSPGTAFAVTGGGSICSGDPGLSVGLAGSETGVSYQLKLNGTDTGSPLAGTGSALDFGLQTGSGSYTVLASNTTSSCVGLMTGSATLTLNTAPGITTSPAANLTNSVGGSQSFTVVATGSGLTYQWRRAGTNLSNAGNISGATTASLTVNPVALSDAASYDCVVSGTCSPAATSTASSFFVKIPANLIWVGDGTANLWDTTTANWAGPATFSTADNVTINDTGNNTVPIDLVGTISPTLVTVNNSTKDFTIGTTTTGILSGPAVVTKSGSGTLTLTSSNAFTGKATVNGGTLSITTGNNLGTPPGSFVADQLTLNGGALQVTASGSINANRGTTLGASGGTLDIPTGVNFTNAPAVTGAGSLAKIGAGALVFANANTYGGGTVISNGTISIGNLGSLGTGGITLAGGTLNPTAAFDALTNDITLTADSTISGGNIAPRFNGALSGSAGTLTISGSAATFAPRLQGAFTFNRPIVLANGNTSVRCYNTNTTQTFAGVISGAGNLHRRSAVGGIGGETILSGDNTYSGGTTLTEGGLGFGISSTGDPVTSGPLGTGTLTYGDSGNSTASIRTIYAVGGARTVANAIVMSAAQAVQTNVIAGANDLTLAGTIDLGATNRQFIVDNTGITTFAGIVSNGGITKEGNGVLRLNGANTYTGPTLVSAGTLGGTGVVSGPVSVAVGGNLAPGASIGTLTINNDLTLGGTFTAEVNSSASPNCDKVTGVGILTYGGTLAIVNNGPALAATDTFQIFSATTYGGAFASITPATPGAGLVWNTNTLTTDGILRIAAGGGGPATNPTNIVTAVGGGNLTMTWPADHIGWTLQTQTNSRSVGLVPASNAWFNVSGSTTTNQVVIPISPAEPTVFYRLKL
ncbi:MAG: hypothetical protein RLY20_3340 [Verrucomicrobiota bacterium]